VLEEGNAHHHDSKPPRERHFHWLQCTHGSQVLLQSLLLVLCPPALCQLHPRLVLSKPLSLMAS